MDTPRHINRLREGDRIQLIRPLTGITMGTAGTILREFVFDSFCDVCFDGYPTPRLVTTRDLAPAPPEESPA